MKNSEAENAKTRAECLTDVSAEKYILKFGITILPS